MLRLITVLVTAFAAASAAAQTQIPSGSRLKSITATQTIRIAYRADATPFSFVNDRKEPVGFTIDLCKVVVSSIQRQFGLDHLKIEWVPVDVQTRFSAVSSGKADLECGSSTVTLGRMKEVDFSNIVFVETTGVAVRKASNIRSFSDVGGKKIAVVSGTTNERATIAALKQRGLEATLVPVKNVDEGAAKLEAGELDALASAKLLLVGANTKKPDTLVMLPDDLSIEPHAIVLPQGDWALRLAVNTGLAQIFRSEEITLIFKGWFERAGLQLGPIQQVMYALGALQD